MWLHLHKIIRIMYLCRTRQSAITCCLLHVVDDYRIYVGKWHGANIDNKLKAGAIWTLHRQIYLNHTLSTNSLRGWRCTVSNAIQSCQSVFISIVYSLLIPFTRHEILCVGILSPFYCVYTMSAFLNYVYLWCFMLRYFSEMTKK